MTDIAMHGHGVRGMKPETLHSFDGIGDPGKFGVMFPNLLPLFASDDALAELADAMLDKLDGGGNPVPAGDNPDIPAGYTFLGQFVDHDITLDTTPLDQQKADPLATTNFRTPALDLDSVYGDGPGIHPYLYQRDPAKAKIIGKLLIGHTAESGDQNGRSIPALPNDLPRNQIGHALIFDERNDENLLVAQFHLLMLKFHNKVFDKLAIEQPTLSDDARFKEARRIVTWHYQWIVLFDFVERLTEPGLIQRISTASRNVPTCRRSLRPPVTGLAIRWCGRPIATIKCSTRPRIRLPMARLVSCFSSPENQARSSANLRRRYSPHRHLQRRRSCRPTGSSTGGVFSI